MSGLLHNSVALTTGKNAPPHRCPLGRSRGLRGQSGHFREKKNTSSCRELNCISQSLQWLIRRQVLSPATSGLSSRLPFQERSTFIHHLWGVGAIGLLGAAGSSDCLAPLLQPLSCTVTINPLNAELNPICPLLALFGAHHIFHVSGLRVKLFIPPVCLTTGPQPPPKPLRHTSRSSASSFNLQQPLVFLRSSSSCLLLPRLLVTFILPSISPSITCFRRQ